MTDMPVAFIAGVLAFAGFLAGYIIGRTEAFERKHGPLVRRKERRHV